MSATKTATVEVLTAEVRVLMVGSRQITLSVFRQLDHTPYAMCEAFGRVNDSVQGNGEKMVIGKHKETGVLTRSDFPFRKRPLWTTSDEKGLQEAIRNAKEYQNYLDRNTNHNEYTRKYWAQEVRQNRELAEALQNHKDKTPEHQERYDKMLAAYQDLPLIILAGLK